MEIIDKMNLDNLKELENLSSEEKDEVLKILNQISSTGTSEDYNKLLLEDYDEIPVDIETFLRDKKYLGNGLIDDEGRFTVYAYWINLLKEIFPDPLAPSKYNTLALTGSIGIGKSFVAVLCMLYELYRMLCLKDPYVYYGLQPIDKITFAVMNITLDASKGVAWDKMQQLIQSSEWFLSRGSVRGDINVEWSPSKNIELIAGSLSRHIIGRAVFSCLDGDTKILTNKGHFKIKDLVDKDIQVFNLNDDEVNLSDYCTVKPTSKSNEEYQIELEDGTMIKCTPNHRFMLTDGSYKEAQYLTEQDEIMEYKPIGYIYRTTNVMTKQTYVGQHHKSLFDKNYYGSGLLIQRSLNKYGKKNHIVEILAWAKTQEELNDLETEYIRQERALNEHCLNLSDGAKGGHENYSHATRFQISSHNKNKIAITDGYQTKYVSKDINIPEGWIKGNCNTSGSHNMTKYWNDPESQERNRASKSGCKNSSYNNGYRISGEKNGKALTTYYFKDKRFGTRKELVEYLKSNNYNVSLSTIRQIELGGFKYKNVENKYKDIIDNLKWEVKNED